MKKIISFLLVSLILILSTSLYSLAEKSVDELEEETAALTSQLSSINSEILEMQSELDETAGLIEIAESNIAKTELALQEAEEEEEAQYEDMKDRIQYMYESGDTSFLEILLGAEDMADFINRSDFVNSITEYDREMLDKLTETKETIEVESVALEENKESLLALQEEYETKTADLEAKAVETETDLTAVKADLAAAEAAEKAAAEAAANASSGSSSSGSSSSGSSSSGGTTSSGGSYSGSASELDLLAALLDCEAYADYNSRLAVATVIMNRVEDSRFPNTITGVIYASGQFPCATNGKVASVLAKGPSSLSYQVAEDAINGTRLSSVSNCYFFLAASSTNRTGVNVGGNLFFASW